MVTKGYNVNHLLFSYRRTLNFTVLAFTFALTNFIPNHSINMTSFWWYGWEFQIIATECWKLNNNVHVLFVTWLENVFFLIILNFISDFNKSKRNYNKIHLKDKWKVFKLIHFWLNLKIHHNPYLTTNNDFAAAKNKLDTILTSFYKQIHHSLGSESAILWPKST